MARGFVMGAIWGTVVAGLGAGAMSIALGTPVNAPKPMPDVPEVKETAAPPVEAPAPAPAAAPKLAPQPEPEAKPAPEPKPVAQMSAEPAKPGRRPDPETDVDLPEQAAPALDTPDAPAQIGADTEPLAAPQVGAAPQALETTAEGQSARVAVSTDAPVMPAAQADAPGMPAPEQDLSISTDPAQPPMPDVPQAETALVADEPVPATNAEAAPEPVVETQSESEESTATEDEATAAESAGLGTPAGTLTDRDPAVPQGRLPTIGGDDTAQTAESAAVESETATLTDESPLVRFATKVDAAADLPRMAIVLIDDGSGPLGPEALEAFPFPVTFAIAPSHPDPAKTAAAYRELGFEVMALADVPEGAQASDVEVILAGTLDTVPQAIGLLEDPDGNGIQSSRAISTQVSAYLAASGHGLVTLPKGLNTAQQLAAKEGVPSATLFRDFDGEGQDARVIRRFLDQAAFRSRQEGAVIMLGRLRADTVSALVLWGLQDRASSVALVPVSLVLQEAAEQ
ncbi:divergent polysaccharide deacetylase family protein [Primorskyibacter sp. 2E233]|uniref:divergent polysaccharide deacetylase family protein n=1 Tax=Primorskyibacter sp. 2E233 TaxID=3413431 RepID=UPI003BF2FE30